ncbi:MAG: VOC family protein [Proteobacteria bacterium]|nr:VOC family protein [Pseudomonadota bacterium]
MVTDLARSVAFYTDVLGFELAMSVDGAQGYAPGSLLPDAVFATLRWGKQELMLQTNASLAEDVPTVFAPDAQPTPAGTLYLRGFDPNSVDVPADHIIKPLERAWYGMNELYLRDPDGHVICLAMAEGPPPEST